MKNYMNKCIRISTKKMREQNQQALLKKCNNSKMEMMRFCKIKKKSY